MSPYQAAINTLINAKKLAKKLGQYANSETIESAIRALQKETRCPSTQQ